MSTVARLLVLPLTALALWASACSPVPEARGSIPSTDLAQRIQEGTAPLVLDVRSAEEYQAGHIPGAVNIPHDELPARLAELRISTTDEIVVHCESGRRAARAEEVLVQAGYSAVRDLDGHMKAWRAAGLPTE
jgi:phage shock protein E